MSNHKIESQVGNDIEGPRTDRSLTDPWLLAVIATLILMTLLAHDIGYLLSHPFWLDEAWVAVLSRFPVEAMRERASGTPIGWLLLMRLVPGEGEQRFRLLPLGFSVGSAVVASVLAYGLAWTRRWKALTAALFAGTAAVLTPAALLRNDLKQYTSDAFVSLLVLLLAGRLDSWWTRRRLAALIGLAIVGALFSYTSMFVSAAVLIALLFMSIHADRNRVPQVLVAGTLTAISFCVIAVVFVLPGLRPALYEYWQSFFIDANAGFAAFAGELWVRLGDVIQATGFGSALGGLILAVLGLRSLALLGRPTVASGFFLLLVIMLLLGLLQRYPLFDVRTSQFMLIAFVVLASVGVVYHLLEVGVPSLRMFLPLLVIFAALIATALPYVRAGSIPNEDVRSQVRRVEADRVPGDIVLVNMPASYGLGYYWTDDDPVFVENDSVASGWTAGVDREDVVFATDRTESEIANALNRALEKAEQNGGRLWIVLSHLSGTESELWQRALSEQGVEPVSLPVGPEPLILIE